MRASDTPRMKRAQLAVHPEFILKVKEYDKYVEITGVQHGSVVIYKVYDDGSVVTA